MRLPPYPPHDFKCVYQHSCPYLDWLSTTWVLEEYRRAGGCTRNICGSLTPLIRP